jgi:hypothetical protein
MTTPDTNNATNGQARYAADRFCGGRQIWFAMVLRVLHGGNELERVACTGEVAQMDAPEATVDLEMGKTHLHFLVLVARLLKLGGILQ